MAKTYQFICKKCGQLFDTPNINMPICRWCVQEGIDPQPFGKPQPSPLQEAKWKRGRQAKKLRRK